MYTKNNTSAAQDAAVNLVQKSALSSLTNMTSNVNGLQISNVSGTALSACSSQTSIPNGYNACNEAVTNIQAIVSSNLSASVMQGAISGYMQTFMQQFNGQFLGSIFLAFMGPVFVSAPIRITLEGVLSTMPLSEQQIVTNSFFAGFGPLMAAANPSMNLTDMEIMIQQWSQVNDTLTGATETYNDMEVFVAARCMSTACTNSYLKNFLYNQGNQYCPTWRQNLLSLGAQNKTNYFVPLANITIDGDIMDLTNGNRNGPPPSLPALGATRPAWMWITLAADLIIVMIGIAVAYILVVRRQRAIATADQQKQQRLAEKEMTSPTMQEEPIPMRRQPSSVRFADDDDYY